MSGSKANTTRSSSTASTPNPAKVCLTFCHKVRPNRLHSNTSNEFGANKTDVVFCGDSGNDVFPLTAGFSGVLVRNADDQLVAKVKQVSDANPELRVYFAKGSFKGLNGYYTSGVIEGAYHYGVFYDSN